MDVNRMKGKIIMSTKNKTHREKVINIQNFIYENFFCLFVSKVLSFFFLFFLGIFKQIQTESEFMNFFSNQSINQKERMACFKWFSSWSNVFVDWIVSNKVTIIMIHLFKWTKRTKKVKQTKINFSNWFLIHIFCFFAFLHCRRQSLSFGKQWKTKINQLTFHSPFLFTDFDLFIYFVVKKEVMLCENSDNNNKKHSFWGHFDEINIFIMEKQKKKFFSGRFEQCLLW